MISWQSRKPGIVALSSCEAEYMGFAAATQEGLYLLQFMSDLDANVKTFDVYGDNQGSVSLARNPVGHQRSKHIDVRYHFIRCHVNSGQMNLMFVPT